MQLKPFYLTPELVGAALGALAAPAAGALLMPKQPDESRLGHALKLLALSAIGGAGGYGAARLGVRDMVVFPLPQKPTWRKEINIYDVLGASALLGGLGTLLGYERWRRKKRRPEHVTYLE